MNKPVSLIAALLLSLGVASAGVAVEGPGTGGEAVTSGTQHPGEAAKGHKKHRTKKHAKKNAGRKAKKGEGEQSGAPQ